MCYSVRIKAALKELSWEFRAQLDLDAFSHLFELRVAHPELKLPFALDRYFVQSQDAAEAKLAPAILRFHEEELERTRMTVKETERELTDLRAQKPTVATRKKIDVRERRLEKHKSKLELSFDRESPLDERVYPFYFAPAIVGTKQGRKLVPMRYRVRRPDGGEVPPQYNVFNARHDSLLQAATWKPLFGRHHAIFPFAQFYEWVEREGKKKEIQFVPKERKLMWAASLYSPRTSRQKVPFASFAMVTDDPPPEIAEAGHDRCPIFLQSDSIENWLRPEGKTASDLLDLLHHKEIAFYLNKLVA